MAAGGTRRRLRRTWPQRFVILVNVLVLLACLAAAAGVWYANSRLSSLERVVITHTNPETIDGLGSGALGGATTTEVPSGELPAQNFLLVGSDSRDCISPEQADAAAFLGEPVVGGRSDTIMVLRVERNAESAAILSFPRDLWVRINGSNRKSRINNAFDKEDPSRLVRTIEDNFGVHIDHYVDVDFCAFKRMVEVVGGVKIPFAYPTRDRYSGLNVPEPGCVNFDGDAALAYVRSRHYEYFVDGKWKDDVSSDFGRIARQQDFIRRALQKALDRGARQPLVANQLVDAALSNVTVDSNLTVGDMYELATRLRNFDPDTVKTYRLDGRGVIIGGASVIQPDTTSRRARAILDYFRGDTTRVDEEAAAGDDEAEPTTTVRRTTTTTEPSRSTTTTEPPRAGSGEPRDDLSTSTTLDPLGRPDDFVTGVVPPDDPSCR